MNKYTLKVYPKGGSRIAYRVFQTGGDTTLDELCEIILSEFDFDFDHLYEFCMDNKPYSRNSYSCRPDRGEPSTKVCLDEMGLYKGQNFSFHYDFGDDWMFVIHVQSIEAAEGKVGTVTLKSKGKVSQYPDWDDEDEDWDEE